MGPVLSALDFGSSTAPRPGGGLACSWSLRGKGGSLEELFLKRLGLEVVDGRVSEASGKVLRVRAREEG